MASSDFDVTSSTSYQFEVDITDDTNGANFVTVHDIHFDEMGAILFTDVKWKAVKSLPMPADDRHNWRVKKTLKERRFDTRHWKGTQMRKYKVG